MYPEKTIDLSQVSDKFRLYQEHLTMSGIRTHHFSSDRYLDEERKDMFNDKYLLLF
jgi:hypothetical protein